MKAQTSLSQQSQDYNRRKIRLKCRYEGEIRTVTITPDTDIAGLQKRLASDYGFDVALKYADKEGDYITLSSQNDLDDLFLNCESDTVNASVSEAISLPTLQLKQAGKQNSINSTSGFSSSLQSARDQWPAALNTQRFGVTSRVERFPSIDGYGRPAADTHNQVKWKRAEILGQGAFGVVYLGLNIESGELMAVKQMATDEVSKRELSSLENEINLLRGLRHPNIVRYIGTELNSVSMSIFLEYVPGGSLKNLIDKFGALDERVAKSYTRQLLLGLEYLHRNGIAHRDIKGANCLVGNDGVIKLADFGNSKHWRSSNQTAAVLMDASMTGGGSGSGAGPAGLKPAHGSSGNDIKGTPSWMAPEVIRDQGALISWRKADIWSLGCTALEMTSGKPPWSQFNNPVTILFHIACQDTLPEFPHSASLELITFLNLCLQRDPSNRPDVTSLLLHPFVSSMSAAGNNWAGGFTNRPTTVSSLLISEFDAAPTARQEPLSTTAARKWRRADPVDSQSVSATAAASSATFFPDSEVSAVMNEKGVKLTLDLPGNDHSTVHSEQSTPRMGPGHAHGGGVNSRVPGGGARSAREPTNAHLIDDSSAFVLRAVQSARQPDSAQSTPRSARLSSLTHHQNLVHSPVTTTAAHDHHYILRRQMSRESNSSMVSADLPPRQQSNDSMLGYDNAHIVPIRSFSALSVGTTPALDGACENDGSSSGNFIDRETVSGASGPPHDSSIATAKNPEVTHEVPVETQQPYIFQHMPQEVRQRLDSDVLSVNDMGGVEDSMDDSYGFGSAAMENISGYGNAEDEIASAAHHNQNQNQHLHGKQTDDVRSGPRTTVIPPLSSNSARTTVRKRVISNRSSNDRSAAADNGDAHGPNRKFMVRQSSKLGSDGEATDASGSSALYRKQPSGAADNESGAYRAQSLDRTARGKEKTDRRDSRGDSAQQKHTLELKQHENIHKKRMEQRSHRGEKDEPDSDAGSISSFRRRNMRRRRESKAMSSTADSKRASDMEASVENSPSRIRRKGGGSLSSKSTKTKSTHTADNSTDDNPWRVQSQQSAVSNGKSSTKPAMNAASGGSLAAAERAQHSARGTSTSPKLRVDSGSRRVIGIASARQKQAERQHHVHWRKKADEEVGESDGNASFEYNSLQSSSCEHLLDGDNSSVAMGEPYQLPDDEIEDSKDSFVGQSTVLHDLEQSMGSVEKDEAKPNKLIAVGIDDAVAHIDEEEEFSALVDAHIVEDEEEIDEQLDIPDDDEIFNDDDDDEIEEQSMALSVLRTVPSANTTAAIFQKNKMMNRDSRQMQSSAAADDDGKMVVHGAGASRGNVKTSNNRKTNRDTSTEAPTKDLSKTMPSRTPSSLLLQSAADGEDNKSDMKHVASRRSLDNFKSSVHRTSTRSLIGRATDPLEMSTDSLDPLQITGMASAAGGPRPGASYGDTAAAAGKIAAPAGRIRRGPGTASTAASAGARYESAEAGPSIGSMVIAATPKSAGRSRSSTAGMVAVDSKGLDQPMDDEMSPPRTRRAQLTEMKPLLLHEHTAAITRLRAPLKTALLLSASVDGTIRIWDEKSSSSRCTLHAAGFEAAEPTGTKAERQQSDNKPERRLSSTGAHIRQMAAQEGNDTADEGVGGAAAGGRAASARNVKFLQLWAEDNCASIWAAGSDSAIRIWSGAEGRPQRILRGHEDGITAMEGIDPGSLNSNVGSMLQASSCLLATGSADRTVRIWDGRAKKAQVFLFRGHGDTVLALRWGEGGRSIISSGKDKAIRVWDTRAGRLRVTMEKHFGSIHTLRVLPESSLQQSSKGQQLPFLISGGRDSMLNFWTSTGDCMSSQAAHRGSVGFISEVNFDAPNLRAASANPTADTATGKSHMGFGCGNPLMISLGNDSVIKLWDVRRFKCVTEINPSDLPSTAPPPQRQQRPSKSRVGSALLNGTFTKAVWCPRSNNIGGDGGVSFVTGSSAGVVRIYEFNAAAAAATKAAAVAITTAAGAGGGGNPPGSAHQHHDSSSWVETDLASHTDGCSCSDLIVGERLVASSSRGGQILSWRW